MRRVADRALLVKGKKGEFSEAAQRTIRSVEDLLSLAEELEKEAAARYRGLSARMARQGDTEMAAEFEALARMEELHVDHVADRVRSLQSRAPATVRMDWELPSTYDEDEARGATLSAYQALAFAVRNEEPAFAFYSCVAAEAKAPAVRALAEDLARDELEHAAILRRHRRRPFHSKRPIRVELPRSVAALLQSARQWDGVASVAHAALAKALDEAGESEDAALFQRLAVEEEKAAAGAIGAPLPTLYNAEAGLRLLEDAFDRFALIVERSNEDVVAEAQRLSAYAVARLALAGGARRNT